MGPSNSPQNSICDRNLHDRAIATCQLERISIRPELDSGDLIEDQRGIRRRGQPANGSQSRHREEDSKGLTHTDHKESGQEPGHQCWRGSTTHPCGPHILGLVPNPVQFLVRGSPILPFGSTRQDNPRWEARRASCGLEKYRNDPAIRYCDRGRRYQPDSAK